METYDNVWAYWLNEEMIADVVSARYSRKQTAGVRPFTVMHKFDPLQVGCVVALLNVEAHDPTELLDDLAQRHSPLSVVYFVEKPSARAIVAAIGKGACDVLDWPAERERLGGAIERALAASVAKERCLVEIQTDRDRIAALNSGDLEVLKYMLGGIANKNTAKLLGIAVRTVEARRKHIFDKLGTRNLVEIAVKLKSSVSA